MRVTAHGWARDCGANEIFDIELSELPTTEGEFRFSRSKPVLGIKMSPHPSLRGNVRSVSLHCHANLRLGGDYNIEVSLNKHEIAHLFYLSHKREVHCLTDLFPLPVPEPEETADPTPMTAAPVPNIRRR